MPVQDAEQPNASFWRRHAHEEIQGGLWLIGIAVIKGSSVSSVHFDLSSAAIVAVSETLGWSAGRIGDKFACRMHSFLSKPVHTERHRCV